MVRMNSESEKRIKMFAQIRDSQLETKIKRQEYETQKAKQESTPEAKRMTACREIFQAIHWESKKIEKHEPICEQPELYDKLYDDIQEKFVAFYKERVLGENVLAYKPETENDLPVVDRTIDAIFSLAFNNMKNLSRKAKNDKYNDFVETLINLSIEAHRQDLADIISSQNAPEPTPTPAV